MLDRGCGGGGGSADRGAEPLELRRARFGGGARLEVDPRLDDLAQPRQRHQSWDVLYARAPSRQD